MRQDQFVRLQELEEKLADVFIDEAEPDNWPGAGIPAATMDKQTRGDRYWVKKNAVATLSLMQRVAVTIGQVQLRGTGTTPPPEKPDEEPKDHLDDEVSGYEAEATALLKEMQDGARKTVFDRKVHGR